MKGGLLNPARNGDRPCPQSQCKLIDSQANVGGWPELSGVPAPSDRDQDGMPDDWEKSHGINPADPADRNAHRAGDGDGYTNLEQYLNSLCPP